MQKSQCKCEARLKRIHEQAGEQLERMREYDSVHEIRFLEKREEERLAAEHLHNHVF